MAKSKTRLRGRKTAAQSLEWQLQQAEDLHMRLIGLILTLEEVPDRHLPQAPLARGSLALISDLFRKWKVKVQKEIDAEKARAAEKAKPKKRRARRKKVVETPEKND
tara:strand:- start:1612 stop:1932 length:321 start_codon:yes stop_codon:yes gene_type:complete